MARTAPLPRSSPIVASQVDPSTGQSVLTGYISSAWDTYFQLSQVPRIEASPERLSTVDTGSKTAAISTTALPIGSVTAGLYRVTYYARITTAASTSSSLTVTIGWADSSITCSQAGAAMTGNTTSTVQSSTILFRSDQSAPLTYATAYSSSGGTAMVYRVYLVAEQIPE